MNPDEDIKEIQDATAPELFFPGPIKIVEALANKHNFRTLPEIGTDREPIYYFNGQIYERAEELIKEEAHSEYIHQWIDMKANSNNKELNARLESALNRGPSANDINEVLSMIRRTTFTRDEMNPTNHIPFRNGLLNLKTRQLEPFTPNFFYTYQINANLLDKHVTMKDTPKFSYLLGTAFYQKDIPMILTYSAYSFHPDFPQHKVLFVLGRQRIGKGTVARVLQELMPKGSGSISLARLLTSERFTFTGIEGKNLLIDSETKRKFRRGTVLEWSAFCNLFGKDVLSVEPKGHEAHDYVSRAKGIFLGNLPFIPVDSPPAITRMLLVITRNEPPKRVIPDLDKLIMESERDLIATLLIQILFKLSDRNFVFPGQISDDQTAQLLDKLADPVENFIEEETEYDEDHSSPVDDAYSRFQEWCKEKGIPTISRQTFVKKFGHAYPKKRAGPRGNRTYIFSNCYLYETDVKVNDQVGHGLDYAKTPKITAFAGSVTRVQHEYTEPPAEEEEVAGHDIRYSAHKLDTASNVSGTREIKGLVNTKSVSNLNQGEMSDDSKNDHNDVTHSTNSSLHNEPKEKKSFSISDGNMIRDQLLNMGYLLDSRETGLSIFGQKYTLAIRTPKHEDMNKLLYVLSRAGFIQQNTGAMGYLFFSKDLTDIS